MGFYDQLQHTIIVTNMCFVEAFELGHSNDDYLGNK